jgi:hypothetical protein
LLLLEKEFFKSLNEKEKLGKLSGEIFAATVLKRTQTPVSLVSLRAEEELDI